MKKDIPTLKIGTGWIDLSVIGEPDVVLTFKGYAPILPVKIEQNGLEYNMYISAKSISGVLENYRINNNNKFTGLKLSIRKASEDRFALYEIKNI